MRANSWMHCSGTMIDLRPDDLAVVQAILNAELPGREVWVFGSRAKGTARESSDLDLAILGPHPLPFRTLTRLRRTFEDSYLPFTVDLVDWNSLDEDFRAVVRSQKQVLQSGDVGGEREKGAPRRAVPLKDCAHIVTGGKPPPRNRPEFWNGDIPWVTARDMKPLRLSDTERHVTAEAMAQGSRLVPAETVLVLVRGLALQEDVPICIALRPLSFGPDIRGLIAQPGVVPEYLLHALRGSKTALRSLLHAGASGIPLLPSGPLANFPIALPPASEQQAIARVLDSLEDRIERDPRLRDLFLPKLISGEIRPQEALKRCEEMWRDR